MGWVKEANRKYKHYVETRHGFRIYRTKFAQRHVYIEDREDGQWRVTDLLPGRHVAINRDGLGFARATITELWWDIDIYHQIGHIMGSVIKTENNGKQ